MLNFIWIGAIYYESPTFNYEIIILFVQEVKAWILYTAQLHLSPPRSLSLSLDFSTSSPVLKWNHIFKKRRFLFTVQNRHKFHLNECLLTLYWVPPYECEIKCTVATLVVCEFCLRNVVELDNAVNLYAPVIICTNTSMSKRDCGKADGSYIFTGAHKN